MKKHNYILIDCVCDLSNDFLEGCGVEPVRFYLHLQEKRFKDGYEISLANVIEHYAKQETKIISCPPSVEELFEKYRRLLTTREEILHLTISSKISDCYEAACKAKQLLGPDARRVHVIDTCSLSNGMALLLIRAVELNEQGKAGDEIEAELQKIIPKVNVRFVTPNADYLAINERVSRKMSNLFKTLKLRPVFGMEAGKLTATGFEFGKESTM